MKMDDYNIPKHRDGKTALSLSMALAASAVVMGFIGVAMPSFAVASEQSSPRQEIVRFHDLDLTKIDDADELNLRVRRAAKRVCDQPGVASVMMQRQKKKCAEQAYGRAWADASAVISNRRLAIQIRD